MNGYLLSVIATILLSSVLTAILPNGKTAVVIKAMTKLACLLIIISPILQYIRAETGILETNSSKNLSQSVIQTDESFITYYSEMRVDYAQTQLESEIREQFDLESHVTIFWAQEEEGIRITKISVTFDKELTDEAKSKVCEYLTKNYCSEVLIE